MIRAVKNYSIYAPTEMLLCQQWGNLNEKWCTSKMDRQTNRVTSDANHQQPPSVTLNWTHWREWRPQEHQHVRITMCVVTHIKCKNLKFRTNSFVQFWLEHEKWGTDKLDDWWLHEKATFIKFMISLQLKIFCALHRPQGKWQVGYHLLIISLSFIVGFCLNVLNLEGNQVTLQMTMYIDCFLTSKFELGLSQFVTFFLSNSNPPEWNCRPVSLLLLQALLLRVERQTALPAWPLGQQDCGPLWHCLLHFLRHRTGHRG